MNQVRNKNSFFRRNTARLTYLLLHLNKKDVQIFFACLSVAALLWFFNALNKERTEVLTYPIEFIYDTENYVVLEPLPEEVLLNVKGSGWQLMRASLGLNVTPIRYRIRNPVNRRDNFILGEQLKRSVANSLDDILLEDILTDTISIALDRYKTRTLRLKIDESNIRLEKNHFIQEPIRVSPQTIEVRGPRSFVNTLDDPYTISFPDEVLSKDYEGELPLRFDENMAPLLELSAEDVQLRIQVKQYIKQSATATVRPLYFPRDSSFYLSSDQLDIPITYLIPKGKSRKFRTDLFDFVADFREVDWKDSTVRIKLMPVIREIGAKNITHPARLKLRHDE